MLSVESEVGVRGAGGRRPAGEPGCVAAEESGETAALRRLGPLGRASPAEPRRSPVPPPERPHQVRPGVPLWLHDPLRVLAYLC